MAIKIGDLVMVVRWPHRHFGDLDKLPGAPFVVAQVMPGARCYHCGEEFGPAAATGVVDKLGRLGAVPLPWLKKLEPPGEVAAAPRCEERPEIAA